MTSDPMFDYFPVCSVCGNQPEDCACPECPVCHEHGCEHQVPERVVLPASEETNGG